MLWGYALLIATDVVLTLAALWLIRSPRFGDSPSVTLMLLATLGAMCLHMAAYSAGQVLVVRLGMVTPQELGERMDLFLVNMVSGIVPAMLYGYGIVSAFANMFSTQILMRHQKPEAISTDAFRRARAYAAQNQYTAAVEECRRLEAEFPDSPLPLIEMAMIQRRANRNEEAADTLRRVLREFPYATEARRRAALALADLLESCLDDPDTAAYLRNDYAPTASVRPEANRAVPQWVEMERARHLAENGDIDRAVETFREVFKRNPDAPRPLFEAATILERVGRPDDAAGVLRALARASTVGSEAWAEAMCRLGRLLGLYFDDPDGRLHTLREVLRKAPGSKAAADARNMLRDDADRLTDI